MDFTFEVSKAYGVLPFQIMKENTDDVILLINYLSETENDKSKNKPVTAEKTPKGEERIRVNDKTATGGWW